MKTKKLILVALLLLSGGLVACDDSEEIEVVGTPPVVASDDVTAFFEKYLPPSSADQPKVEFNFREIDYDETECFLIDSKEDFEAVAPPAVELPAIDFEKYTLLIGQHQLGNPGYILEKQAIDTESDKMTLNLVYSSMEGASATAVTTFYFWGLYSKLPHKTIDIHIRII